LIAVIEMSLASWLVAGRVPGIDRSPLRKQDPDPDELLARPLDCIGGGTKLPKRAIRSTGSRSRMKPATMASGWRGGFGLAASRPISFIPPAFR
jgi:hypothetical protein